MTRIKIRTGVEFRSCRSKQSFKAGGVGLSKKPGDQIATLLLMAGPSSLDKCMFASLTLSLLLTLELSSVIR
jgi:hypothetical protein